MDLVAVAQAGLGYRGAEGRVIMGDMLEFGARLRAHRCAAGLSQQELAGKSGLSAKTIGNLERGRARWPHPSSVLRLADALELSAADRSEFVAAADRRLSGAGGPPAPRQHRDPGTAADVTAGYRHGLPLDTAAFTGRDAQLELIMAVPDGAGPGGVVTLRAVAGMPGVGKTALAVHAAHLLTGAFPDRQLFIDLHGHTPGRDAVRPEDALAGLLAAVGVDPGFLPADLAGRAVLWRDKMAGQRAVLVLDNAASSAQVTPLLPGGGSSLVLITSRRHLADLPGAVVPVLVGTLPPAQARAMFRQLAPRQAGADAALVDELAGLAGNLPLAVSLLARLHARHPSWTLADLIAETRGSLLTLSAEHDSIAAAFDVSWRYLDAARQRLLALLGLHPGPDADAYASAALAGVPVALARQMLDDLHREGLLIETGHRRYRMHDLIRSYALGQARAIMTADEREAALGRLVGYYTRTAARADALTVSRVRATPPREPQPVAAGSEWPDLGGGAAALTWTRAERPNLLACLDHVTGTGQAAKVVALTAVLGGLLRRDGPWAEAVTRHAVAAQAARSVDDRPDLADALLRLGTAQGLAGNYQDAIGTLAAALGVYRDLTDRVGQAGALLELGHVEMLTDDYQSAADSIGQGLEIYRAADDKPGQAGALILLGGVRRRSDDFAGAAIALSQGLDICAALGDRAGQAHALRELGDVRRLTGDYQAAIGHLERALALSRADDDRLAQANALTWLGGVRRLTGDNRAAVADLEQALRIQAGLDNLNGQGNALTLLGEARQATGDYEAAARDLEHALRLFRRLGSPSGQAQVLGWLGDLRRETGDYAASAVHLAETLRLSRSLGDKGGEATALNSVGQLHYAQGDTGLALACHQQALDLAREIASPWDEAHALVGLGRCARADGDLPLARGLLGQADTIFCRTGAGEAAGLSAEIDSIGDGQPAARPP
jgi:tetratricopeptide (TPR) repeat protein/transcriptional regulator with XRE-family HTH domain